MTPHDSSPDARVSWETEREGIPERPGFASSLPEEQRIARPRRFIVALALACLAALLVAVAVIVGALQFETLGSALIDALPDDISAEYSTADIERAVSVLLATLAGLSLLCALLQVLTVRTLVARRRLGARVTYVIIVVLTLAVLAVGVLVRETDAFDVALVGGAALCMVVAAVLAFTPSASRWLRQPEERRSLPIATPART